MTTSTASTPYHLDLAVYWCVIRKPSNKPGDHWICIHVDKHADVGEFFDSLGRPPDTVLKRYMDAACKHWTYNSRQLQSVVSAFCGHYRPFTYFACYNISALSGAILIKLVTNIPYVSEHHWALVRFSRSEVTRSEVAVRLIVKWRVISYTKIIESGRCLAKLL